MSPLTEHIYPSWNKFAEGGQRPTLEMAAWVHPGSHTRRGRNHQSCYGPYSRHQVSR